MGWAGPYKTGRTQPKQSKAKLGRTRPNRKFFFSLGQERPRRAGLGQHWQPSGGRIIFLPSPASCMQHAGGETATKTKEMQGEGRVPGMEEAVAGGAAVVWLVDGGAVAV